MIGKIEKLLKMDDYDLEAVFTPAIVNMLILDIVFTSTLLPIAENTVWWRPVLAIVAPLAAAVVLTRFAMHFFRGVSRAAFEDTLYRRDRLRFPTTSMLLLGDKSTGISMITKNRIREDLKTLYKISLLSKVKEDADEMEARRTAKDAVYYIRKAVADNGDIMTRRKLKRYGMFRNFLGGAVFCLPISVACWVIDFSRTGVSNHIILTFLILYLMLVVIDFFIAKSAAVDYAETLITTFDKINHDEA
jgi:hypothetical protein